MKDLKELMKWGVNSPSYMCKIQEHVDTGMYRLQDHLHVYRWPVVYLEACKDICFITYLDFSTLLKFKVKTLYYIWYYIFLCFDWFRFFAISGLFFRNKCFRFKFLIIFTWMIWNTQNYHEALKTILL